MVTKRAKSKQIAYVVEFDTSALAPEPLVAALRDRLKEVDGWLSEPRVTTDDIRDACVHSMDAVLEFLDKCSEFDGFQELNSKALHIVGEILQEADVGLVHDVIKDRPSPKRRGRASTYTQRLRTYCVASVNMLVDTGSSLQSAAEYVAKEFKAARLVSNKGNQRSGISAKTILTWRSSARSKHTTPDMKIVGARVAGVAAGIKEAVERGEQPMTAALARANVKKLAHMLASDPSFGSRRTQVKIP